MHLYAFIKQFANDTHMHILSSSHAGKVVLLTATSPNRDMLISTEPEFASVIRNNNNADDDSDDNK